MQVSPNDDALVPTWGNPKNHECRDKAWDVINVDDVFNPKWDHVGRLVVLVALSFPEKTHLSYKLLQLCFNAANLAVQPCILTDEAYKLIFSEEVMNSVCRVIARSAIHCESPLWGVIPEEEAGIKACGVELFILHVLRNLHQHKLHWVVRLLVTGDAHYKDMDDKTKYRHIDTFLAKFSCEKSSRLKNLIYNLLLSRYDGVDKGKLRELIEKNTWNALYAPYVEPNK